MRASNPLGADRRAVMVASLLAALVSTTMAWSLGAVEDPPTAAAELKSSRPMWRIQTDDGVIELTNQWNAGDVDPIELPPDDAELESDWKQTDPASVPRSEQPKVVAENPESAHAMPIVLVLALGWMALVILWMRRHHRLRSPFQTLSADDRERVSTRVVVAGPWLQKTRVEPVTPQWVSQMPRGRRAPFP